MGICGRYRDPYPLCDCCCIALLSDVCYSANQVNGSNRSGIHQDVERHCVVDCGGHRWGDD